MKKNLPDDIIKSIKQVVKYRKELGLVDDTEERIKRAMKYQEFINRRQ